jgi:hypothetical protein
MTVIAQPAIEEAIKTIESIKFVCRTLFPPKEQAALSLGIEALKRVKECGYPARCGLMERLPGEIDS